ncbi:23S rRNA (pseudouridine(1915)-N(3))-methyltransferase RlmH [Rhodopila sp.]|uniref:23S rRNA (pseudouridine(1915)-N(3))-methyltransferase RlmH n=1 Tax=Rhodopila sp. TaxID=2480087 RepID=UPI003D11547B
MHLIAIGKLRGGPEYELFERYNTRLRPRMTVTELPQERGSALVIKRKEAAGLLNAVPKQAFVVALDLEGEALASQAFAQHLDQWSRLARTVCFLIGGAEGLDAAVLRQADYTLSLGAMTWPHFLVRAMLAEQLYRAQSILRGHPYHRDGRPSE